MGPVKGAHKGWFVESACLALIVGGSAAGLALVLDLSDAGAYALLSVAAVVSASAGSANAASQVPLTSKIAAWLRWIVGAIIVVVLIVLALVLIRFLVKSLF